VASSLPELLDDLECEYAALRRLVDPLGTTAPEWDLPTPAAGWAVRDQISHLAYFDDAGRMAMVEPAVFTTAAAEIMNRSGDPMGEHLSIGRSMDGGQLLSWWDRTHHGLAAALADVDPGARIPWYGPPMGVLSFVSARLMETWAHGQDVADALNQSRESTDRLRHIAHLGVRARPFSYLVHGLQVPPGWIEVRLESPSGALWSWEIGEANLEGDKDSVVGSALDFCLVVTQRRHIADTDLAVVGDNAVEWMSIAQAFAGPPGPGRAILGSDT
jgi:uncharacterized protein (TIGR03084 family)